MPVGDLSNWQLAYWPDILPRLLPPATALASTVGAVISPIPVPAQFAPRFPDAAPGPQGRPALQHAFSANVAPETARPAASAVVVDRGDLRALPTASHLAAAGFHPLPERTSVPAYEHHADSAARPKVGAPWVPHFFVGPVAPERTTIPVFESHADVAGRPFLHASSQAFAPSQRALPELTVFSPSWSARYPDYLDDAPRKPARWAPTQPFAPIFPPRPERQSPIAAVSHPDALPLVATRAERQMAASVANVQREVPYVWSAGAWADSAPGRAVPANAQPFAFENLPTAPSESPAAAFALRADDFARTAPRRTEQHPAFVLQAKPEQSGPIASIYDDDFERLVRLSVAAVPAFATSPVPERTFTLASSAWHDVSWRAFQRVEGQPAAQLIAPYPDRPAPIAAPVFADRVERAPALAAAHQLAARPFVAFPERVLPAAFISHPDAAPGRAYMAPEQPFFAATLSIDLRSAQLPGQVFADAVFRPFLATSEQLFETSLAPAPETRLPLAATTSFSDALVLRAFPSFTAPAFSANLVPIPDIPLRWQPSFPAAAAGSLRPAALQPDVAQWCTLLVGVVGPPFFVVITLVETRPAGETLGVTFPG